MTLKDRAYILGHTEAELARLEQQAAIFAEPTEDALRRAGLRPGMSVLDLGCGVGDVSMAAARLVGPSGAVLGIDRSGAALDHASARAAAQGLDWLRFETGDITSLDRDAKFDAVIGRFILLHLADPVGLLHSLKPLLARSGVIAFVEMDISSAAAVPELDLFSRSLAWILDLYRQAGVEPDMGSKLYATFRAAGLTPEMTGTCRIEAGPETTVPDYLAESIRTIAPILARRGIAPSAEMEVETLGQRLRSEALAGDHCFIYPRLVGAWARV